MTYFDYGATTPIDNDVLEAYLKASKHFFANNSSLHFLGKEANQMVIQATSDIMKTMGLKNHQLIYTSCATEANNLALLGYTKAYTKGRIITTWIEHPSVYQTMQSLESHFEVIYLPVDATGHISLQDLEQAMTTDTILVSIMWVNNIVGSIMPIKQVIEIVKKFPQVKLHVDIVQGLGKIVPDFDLNEIDMLTFSTHKLYGPKGVGGLFLKNGVTIRKIFYGSEAQNGLRPGTFDTSLVVATAKAIKKFYPLTSEHYTYVLSLFEWLQREFRSYPKIVVNTPLTEISPYVVNISIPTIKGETIVHHLEAAKMYVSTGSACSSKLQKPERTVLAMTHDERIATSSIRITLSHLSTRQEIEDLVTVLSKLF